MTISGTNSAGRPVQVINAEAKSPFVLVCEHASNHMPAKYGGLGLNAVDRISHVAWDPGAMPVATRLAQRLDARLIAGGLSRLIYDCNRPPSAPDAMPEQSERIHVPGNQDLSDAMRAQRVAQVYAPFRDTLARIIAATSDAVIVTIHSFTPIYMGEARCTEIGILHDTDSRLADAMLDLAPAHSNLRVVRNDPYGPEHGVTHTLREHALPRGHLNVMIEIRNDLIATEAEQEQMADLLAPWLEAALAKMHLSEVRV
ncbi:N-formylglutamate amidohydrolase [Puniceibacterium sp. IMCC21224]|uniref:N-formylglutamate amidohydrolase n=1 Tax=Puniceibacterium sp. IMCC21224 TaxID=1618204 RepID=UPI00064DAB47|nr:N-formylglutamate amidohydrolase [Puniceibacterium sp. IMCC21224]KMK66213.1 putative N-formylglutamate amidohydrolase [Puniceibacterium sp. IMCC21224]